MPSTETKAVVERDLWLPSGTRLASVGLVPVLWSSGTGADVMKRIAAPMVGGLVTSFLLELTVYPAIFAIWKGRRLPDDELLNLG